MNLELTERIAGFFPDDKTSKLMLGRNDIAEIRLRINQPAQLVYTNREFSEGALVNAGLMHRILNFLLENSLYAREEELRQGYFTAAGGCRIGVCGKICIGESNITRLANVGSICIRIPRQMKGCADELSGFILKDGLSGILLLSPPGMGKTTMLREIVRLISDSGWNVALVDERREIAACSEGVPTLDVGKHTDVIDGYLKSEAIGMLVRACSPDLIAVDEIGSSDDALAILDAVHCGVHIAATAHARSFQDARMRSKLATLLNEGVFEFCAVLGSQPGRIQEIFRWSDGEYVYAERNPAIIGTVGLYRRGKVHIHTAQEKM